MIVLITGSNGFIGKNIFSQLANNSNYHILEFTRKNTIHDLKLMLNKAEVVLHLAGENRPINNEEFILSNIELTNTICEQIKATNKINSLIFTSSIQSELTNEYGRSKLAAEELIKQLSLDYKKPASVFRLPNVFGKWCKPNYNSVVATFCHNISRNLPITIDNPTTIIKLAYIDDVISDLIYSIKNPPIGFEFRDIQPNYEISLGDLARQIYSFKKSRECLLIPGVGSGLTRALYSTYMSYLPPSEFMYSLPFHSDERGEFVEMLKTQDSGQFSYFTAKPGATRGGHFHHTKTEKFLVIKGKAKFCFRSILTNEVHEIRTSGGKPQIVDTIPGWAHDITNIGDDELVVMLWANENFDPDNPDTIKQKV